MCSAVTLVIFLLHKNILMQLVLALFYKIMLLLFLNVEGFSSKNENRDVGK